MQARWCRPDRRAEPCASRSRWSTRPLPWTAWLQRWRGSDKAPSRLTPASADLRTGNAMTAIATTVIPTRLPLRVTANLVGIGFGLAGLAGSWQAAAQTTSAPDWVAGALAVVAAAAWLAVGAAWVAQLARGLRSLSGELHDGVLGPYVSLLPIVGMPLALDLYPHALGAGPVLFAVFAAAPVLLGGWLTGQWIADRGALHPLPPAYFPPPLPAGPTPAPPAP